jgi:thiol:disulfide interchange protein DsbD
MEHFTFSDPAVQAKLAGFKLLKADVTANNADDKALLARFGLFGPPGILFFDKRGKENKSISVVGFMSAAEFIQTLNKTN